MCFQSLAESCDCDRNKQSHWNVISFEVKVYLWITFTKIAFSICQTVLKTTWQVSCREVSKYSKHQYTCHCRKLWLVSFLFLCLSIKSETLPFLCGEHTPDIYTQCAILSVSRQLAAVIACEWRHQVIFSLGSVWAFVARLRACCIGVSPKCGFMENEVWFYYYYFYMLYLFYAFETFSKVGVSYVMLSNCFWVSNIYEINTGA